MYEQHIEIAHLGECTVSALDLGARYQELTAGRTSFLAEDEAHFSIGRTYPLPRPRVWELLTDLDARNRWEIGSDWSRVGRPSGRSGVGATNHCAASGFIEELLDWRPFDYFTTMLRYRAVRLRVTGELREGEGQTELRWRMALESVLPRALRGPTCHFFARRLMRVPDRFMRLDRLVAAEAGPDERVPAA